MEPPKISYTKSGEYHVAYQVVGDGPIDLVVIPGWGSHLEVPWENPAFARMIMRLASFSRLISFDKRGTGLSDRTAELPTLEDQMDEVRAVMDAVGSNRAALLPYSDGGVIGALFAATYPERTSALVLYECYAKAVQSPDYPWGPTPEVLDQLCVLIEQGWGEGVLLPLFSPSLIGDERERHWWARMERLSASPGAAIGIIRRLFDIDIRPVLSTILVPTLILHRTGNAIVDEGHGKYLAQHIPAATYVELPGADSAPWVGDQDAFVAEIQAFLTGVRPAPEPERVLATVMFTDIVGSTEKAAMLGDRRWREILESYFDVVRGEIDRFRGHEVKTIGDGVLATFDGPARAIRCARAIVEPSRQLGIEVRTGLHTGEVELMGEDVGGLAVHIGARVASLAGPGEVVVSSTVKDLVAGSGIEFEERGTHALKGVPGEWHVFFVTA